VIIRMRAPKPNRDITVFARGLMMHSRRGDPSAVERQLTEDGYAFTRADDGNRTQFTITGRV
jgi:hypothetical protein